MVLRLLQCKDRRSGDETPITFVSNTVKDVTFLLIGAHLNI